MNEQKVIEVLKRLGCAKIRYSGGNVKATCPLAPWKHREGTDRHPSISVKADQNEPSKYKCFACLSAGSTLLGLLYDLKRVGATVDPDLFEFVKKEEDVTFEQRGCNYGDQFGRDILRGMHKDKTSVWGEGELSAYLGMVPQYILDRGISLDTCRRFELGFDADSGRVIFPVRRKSGELVGAMGRAIDAHVSPRYLTYLAFSKSEFVYGEHLLQSVNQGTMAEALDYGLPAQEGIIVVEGMTDVYKLVQLGYENVAALMTCRMSIKQAATLKKLERPLYLMLDWDDAEYEGRYALPKSLRDTCVIYDVPGVTTCTACGSRFPALMKKGHKTLLVCRSCADASKPWEVDKSRKDPDQLTPSELLNCLENSKRINISS